MSILAQLFNKNGDKIDPINHNYEKQLENHNNRINLLEQKKQVYSTSEVKTNKVYIDANGKEWPIYRKMFIVNLPNGATRKTIDISSLNINNIWLDQGSSFLKNLYNASKPLNVMEDSTYYIRTEITSSNIVIFYSDNSYYRGNANIVIEYTKTTD